jgi:hypothetical protein
VRQGRLGRGQVLAVEYDAYLLLLQSISRIRGLCAIASYNAANSIACFHNLKNIFPYFKNTIASNNCGAAVENSEVAGLATGLVEIYSQILTMVNIYLECYEGLVAREEMCSLLKDRHYIYVSDFLMAFCPPF